MLIHSIQLSNFLSFGKNIEEIPLGPLNIIIGPNGSGKSNLLEAFELLRNAPEQLLKPFRDSGVREWLWKGVKETPIASLEVIVNHPKVKLPLRYQLDFTEKAQRFDLVDERIEDERQTDSTKSQPYFYYQFNDGHPTLNVKGKSRKLQQEHVDLNQSILSQRRDPLQYPEITYLAQVFGKISLYREWSFGRYTVQRMPQKADLPNDLLEPDASNLGLIMNRFAGEPDVKRRILKALRDLYEGIDDYWVKIEGGTVQVFLMEGDFKIPATRLSDGTLRYLCLLAILCNPTPPPLICIEEPELGLHPNILPTLAELLKEASERTQIIITTHSDTLVDAMTDCPEVVLVAEKTESGTNMTRLNAEKLKPWLEKYRLGQLWMRGDIGGTRW